LISGFFYILMIMKKVLITTISFFVFINTSYSLYKAPYHLLSQFSLKSGVYFDNLTDINKFLKTNDFPELSPENVWYFGLNYTSNHFPVVLHDLPNIYLSLDFRYPVTRSIEKNYSVKMQTPSIFIEAGGFQDIINHLTMYPILGFGLAWTDLDITSNGNNIESEKIIKNESKSYSFTKFNALLNLGGGFDYRYSLREELMQKVSLIIGINVRYSLSLDAFGMYDRYWKSNGLRVVDMPSYHAPELSIELKLGIEFLQRLKEIK
jgi:hypothetical protein